MKEERIAFHTWSIYVWISRLNFLLSPGPEELVDGSIFIDEI
jgi:hypothetical protein